MKVMRRIVGLPVDGRPVVRSQVAQLVALANASLLLPPIDALGYFRVPADRDALAEWLLAAAVDADGIVVSLDMLVYGGLVPSRYIDEHLDALQTRLQVLRQLKARAPHLPIYAFAATMRISNNNVNDEEKDYWSSYGEKIWQWSYWSDRAAVETQASSTHHATSAALAKEAEAAVPVDIRADYLATRARNFAVTHAALGLVTEGVIDRLILPQDDTAPYGFNIAERRQLEAAVLAHGLADRVKIYAGADEVMHTLCAHLLPRLSGEFGATLSAAPIAGTSSESLAQPKALRVYLAFADASSAAALVARYEDRPLPVSLASQFDAAGCVLVEQIADADVVVGVWTCGGAQGDWAMEIALPAPARVAPDWLDALENFARQRPLAILDLAYANGGDPVLIDALATRGLIARLVGYAAWNTASNAIGSLAAQLGLRSMHAAINNDVQNRAVVALRLVEDFLYQSKWREFVRQQLQVAGETEQALGGAALTAKIDAAFRAPANAWLVAHGFEFELDEIRLPWARTFEIGITLKLHNTPLA
jgi:hypothetical protein